MAIKVAELDFADPVWYDWRVEGYTALRILLKLRGRPVGWTWISSEDELVISAESVHRIVEKEFGEELDGLREQMSQPDESECDAQPLGQVPPISVIVCTRNRAHMLERCLASLRLLEYPNYEIVVVDNAPDDNSTAELAARLSVRYLRENRAGLDWARNRGISEARHQIVAFTDDDACADRRWLRYVESGFRRPEVMAVTGYVAPLELETRAQELFEVGYGGMGHGLRRREVRRDELTATGLSWASSFGVGANMAFRRDVFKRVGGFDTALDVGTLTGGGGDVEMFHRIVASGHTLLYEPAALIWHRHRREMVSLRRQLFNNGRSFAAYLLTCMRNRTLGRLHVARFYLLDWMGGWIISRLVRPNGFPRSLILAELCGAVIGPAAYFASQARARTLGKYVDADIETQATSRPCPTAHPDGSR